MADQKLRADSAGLVFHDRDLSDVSAKARSHHSQVRLNVLVERAVATALAAKIHMASKQAGTVEKTVIGSRFFSRKKTNARAA